MSVLKFDHTVLDNGLTIIGEHNPQAKSFAAGYFVKTGARDETPEVSGVSHFLEHMMFKGTDRRSAEDINREFDELGANYNAYTSDEQTVYYGAVLAERAFPLLDLLTDMMRPALRQDDFDIEKHVILEEIAMYEDRPNFKVFEEGNRLFYDTHPLGNSILGSPASIRALKQEQMLDYFQARYAADNLVLAVAGAYDWAAIVDSVQRFTSAWKPSGASRAYPLLATRTGHEVLENPKLKRTHVAVYAPGVSAQDPLRYTAALLATCLGDDSGSRLYWALVDKGLAESASLSHDSADHGGAFVGYVSTGLNELPQVLDTYRAVLQDAQASGVSDDEWIRAQRKLATGLTLRGETPFGRLMSLGSSYLYNREYRSVQDVVDSIMAATPADAMNLLEQRPFDQLFTLSLQPTADTAAEPSAEDTAEDTVGTDD